MKNQPNKVYFRWKEDICGFVSEYWDDLWPLKAKSQSWENTVASALSMHQDIFKTGIEVMKQPGWWSLFNLEPPIPILKKNTNRVRNRTKSKVKKEEEDEVDVQQEEIKNETENDKLLLTLAKYIASKSEDEDIFTLKMESVKKKKLELLEPEEEWILLQRTEKAKPCPVVNRLRRKLLLRRLKRTIGLKLFNIDSKVKKYLKSTNPIHPFDINDDVEPSLKTFPIPYVLEPKLSFSSKLNGFDELFDSQISTFTNRTLKPFIYRDYEIQPMKLGVLRELPLKCFELFPNKKVEKVKYPVDYCYFHRKHLKQVNNLLSQFFWPGIDVSEALDYPDFSIIALYKKLIIGAAFMTPMGYITYFFVHPDWERAGVGTFMMYHLIQTCQGKDITLHVSASNPAMILYQKFGFKPEQFIVNFYDKYYPSNDHRASKNALFIRLRR